MGQITCMDIAKAVKSMMAVVNLSGLVEQKEGEPLRQFGVSSIEEGADSTLMRIEFAKCGFRLNISVDPDFINSEE